MNEINLEIPSGRYVVAVSGGVDSMVLIDILKDKKDLKLTIAHFDHGIRSNSKEDLDLVRNIGLKYGIPFIYDQGNLGIGASELDARKVRYDFLRKVKVATSANAIITAHHQDDILETAIHNLIRGTNRKGLSSLKTTDEIIRLLKDMSKEDIYEYAKKRNLTWNEDYTNQDISYKRNYIRHKIINRFNNDQKNQFIRILKTSNELNNQIDEELCEYLNSNSVDNKLNRLSFIVLPHKVAVEIMATWLRKNGVREFDKKLLEKLTIEAKTLRPKQRSDINIAYFLEINKDYLALIRREC